MHYLKDNNLGTKYLVTPYFVISMFTHKITFEDSNISKENEF